MATAPEPPWPVARSPAIAVAGCTTSSSSLSSSSSISPPSILRRCAAASFAGERDRGRPLLLAPGDRGRALPRVRAQHTWPRRQLPCTLSPHEHVGLKIEAGYPGHRGTSHKTTAAAGIARAGKLRKDPRCLKAAASPSENERSRGEDNSFVRFSRATHSTPTKEKAARMRQVGLLTPHFPSPQRSQPGSEPLYPTDLEKKR